MTRLPTTRLLLLGAAVCALATLALAPPAGVLVDVPSPFVADNNTPPEPAPSTDVTASTEGATSGAGYVEPEVVTAPPELEASPIRREAGPWAGLESDGREAASESTEPGETSSPTVPETLAFAPPPPIASPMTPRAPLPTPAPSVAPSFLPPMPPALKGPALTAEQAQLRSGLDSLARGSLVSALAIRDEMPAGAFERRLLNWAIASGGADPGEDLSALADWPGIDNPQRQRERTLLRADTDPAQVIKYFTANPAVSHFGARALAKGYRALGDTEKARLALVDTWRTEPLDAEVENAIIKDFGDVLTPLDHRARMERMFHANRIGSAMRVADLAESRQLADAWSAALKNNRKSLEMLDKIPPALRGAGYYFAKARYLRRTGKYKDAAVVMLGAPRDKAEYADPDSWWEERRVLSRELLDLGDAETAYKLAAAHMAESPEKAVDAEFHAGWYALRFLGDPKRALPHFARIVEISQGASSLSRGYYWMARAMKAGAPGSSRETFEKAAAFGTAFYGQLAAIELGRQAIDVSHPEPAEDDLRHFEERDMVRAVRELETLGQTRQADIFVRALSRQITSPGEMALLVELVADRDLTLALRVGKTAAARGLAVGGLAHPTGAIPTGADISGAGRALAYAVARQESEFNVAAVSSAGARGLLQLLPGTAREMARKAGLVYTPERLTSDAGYNATLGSAFLSEQLDRFDGSYVLTFAGYNAGPKRARDWVTRYGDPRGKPIDEVVDWIERIPFTETRHYVQRVMENYQVYKMRLTGRFALASDLVEGRKMAQR